jgi:uncharacterized repeat protein (TIGR01451 family)
MVKTKWALLAFTAIAVALLVSFGRPADKAFAACADPLNNCMAVDADQTVEPTVEAAATYAVGAPFQVSFDITQAATAWAGYNLVVDHAGLTFIPTSDVSGDTVLESWDYTGLGGTSLNAVVSVPQPDRLQGGSAKASGTTTATGEAVIATFQCDAPGTPVLHLATSAEAVTFSTTLAAGGVVITTDLTDATINCEEQSDWSVEKTDSPDPVLATGQITYTITATNNGPNNSRGLVIFDELPNPLTGTGEVFKEFVSASVDVNGSGPLPCAPGYIGVFPNPFPPPALFSNFVICAIQPGIAPVLPPGSVVTVTIVVNVPIEDAGKIDANIAGAFLSDQFGELAPTVDPDPANEADCAALGEPDANLGCEITTTANGNVTIDKQVDVGAGLVDGGESVAGATVHYKITLTNTGPSPVTGVSVTDDLDAADLTYADNLVTTGANVVCTEPVDLVNDALTCTVGTSDADGDTSVDDMGVGEVATIEYDATYDASLANVTVTNTATVSWTDHGSQNVDSVDVFVRPAAATMVKDPAEANIWLCVDWATDGVDNDGDSTIDNEAPTCTGPGEGELTINEIGRNVSDIDSPNDDDDGDGLTVAPEYCLQFGCPPELGALVDHDGGEVPEGLGAFEFQIKFEHKIVDLDVQLDLTFLESTGRVANCEMTIITENDIRFACVTTGDVPGPSGLGPFVMATIHVLPEPDLYIRLRPSKDNGVVTRLLDENCQWADTLGDPMSATLPGGLLPFCEDTVLTIRWLEGDINGDCEVDLLDEQSEAFRYGTFFGSLWYDDWYDLEPPLTDYDIDVKDLQFVFGRDGSTCQNPYPPQPPQ